MYVGKAFIYIRDKSEKMSGNISKMLQKTVGNTLPQGATKARWATNYVYQTSKWCST